MAQCISDFIFGTSTVHEHNSSCRCRPERLGFFTCLRRRVHCAVRYMELLVIVSCMPPNPSFRLVLTDGTHTTPSTEISVQLSHEFPRVTMSPFTINHVLRSNSEAGECPSSSWSRSDDPHVFSLTQTPPSRYQTLAVVCCW